LKIAYFVHDLNDAAVARRVRMMEAGGLSPVVLGFRRGVASPSDIHGFPVVDLGRTADARLAQRARAVGRNLLAGGKIAHAVRDCDVFLARNLESLVLAARASRGRRLVYECLDVHRTLLGSRWLDRAVQWAEARLLRRVQLLLVSSPAFVSEHFDRRAAFRAPSLLVENKVFATDESLPLSPRISGPPWRIGWFGMLRCRRTLELLTALVKAAGGGVEVLIAGKVAESEFDDFYADVTEVPGLKFIGAYSPADLPDLYRRVHFAWAIDYFEEGLNSSWLLPNRLYEASYHGAIPIALNDVQTAAWLARRDAGIIINDPLPDLLALLQGFSIEDYERERSRMARISISDLRITQPDCISLARALGGAA